MSFGLIGWIVLTVHSRRVPGPPDIVWQSAAGVLVLLTVWLVASMSNRAAVATAFAVVVVGAARSIAYITTDSWSPLGVWIVAVSYSLVVAFAVALVNELEDRTWWESDP